MFNHITEFLRRFCMICWQVCAIYLISHSGIVQRSGLWYEWLKTFAQDKKGCLFPDAKQPLCKSRTCLKQSHVLWRNLLHTVTQRKRGILLQSIPVTTSSCSTSNQASLHHSPAALQMAPLKHLVSDSLMQISAPLPYSAKQIMIHRKLEGKQGS